MISPNLQATTTVPQASVEARERHGHKSFPKSPWHKKCTVRCVKCRKPTAVCTEERCFFDRPRRIWCTECAQLANERWLKGWPNDLAPCPNCWTISFCAGMVLEGSMVHCMHCGYRWPQSGEPWHKDAEAMGLKN